MKIAHIIKDEKFPDSAYEMFEAVRPGCSSFILPCKKLPIKYLKKITPIRVGKYSFFNRRFVAWINSFDALVIHGMSNFSLELINRCRADLKVIWIGMGFDYYDIICESKSDLLKEKTKETVLENNRSININNSWPFGTLKKLRDYFFYPKASEKKIFLERVDYFCPVLESEFHLVKRKIDGWNAGYIDWNYGNSAKVVDGCYGREFPLGCNILLGNSAYPTNNHMDALFFLKKHEKSLNPNSKIIVPLSYGNLKYREIILKEGFKLFGKKFVPLTEMVSYNEYRKIIESCDLVFMNHLRQQAGNNIAQALFMGARVILDSKNPFYVDYKKHGVHLSSVEEVELNPNLLNDSLSFEEKQTNQRVLKNLRGSEAAILKTKVLIKSIESS